MSDPRLTLITRPGCHLCEVATEAIERVDAQTGAGWVEVDVTSDIELEREYGDRVPVSVEFTDVLPHSPTGKLVRSRLRLPQA